MIDSEDIKLVQLLFERDEQVLEQITLQYRGAYKNILRKLLSSEEDISECENDVLLAVWNSIPPNRPQNLCAYICRLARNIGINRFKYNKRAKRGDGYSLILDELSETIPDKSPDNNYSRREENRQINAVISQFLNQLDPETRVLFIRRYYYLESVTELAERFKMSENRVAVKLFRARKKLHKLLEKEGIAI